MTVITIDRSTGDKLRGLSEPVQLRDEGGSLLGEFWPDVKRADNSSVESSSSDNEMQRHE